MNKALFSLSLIGLLVLASCQSQENAAVDSGMNPIVSVKDKVLYQSQLTEVIPSGLPAEDSTKLADSYIEHWINNELMYIKAQENIMNKGEIDRLVDEYRRTLTVNMYQAGLLKEMLTNKVTEQELKAYYDQNTTLFKLKENIMKGLYLKVPINSPQLANLQKWYKTGTDDAVGNIEKTSLQNAVNYDYFYNKWVDFENVMENIPTTISNPDQYLRNNKNLEYSDSSFVYLLHIKEYKTIGEQAPFDYMKIQLEEIFLEKKRSSYLQQIQKDLYDKALNKEQIKFYNK